MSDSTEAHSSKRLKVAEDEDSNSFEYEQYPDDLSFDGLDYATATSHGTYLAGPQEGVESLEDYQAGGYHPVHLDDRLGPEGRYRVIHKLGHGGFSTVWLCRDAMDNRYVAVKVMTADVSPEKLMDLHLMTLDKSAPGAEYIDIPKDHFLVEGPNGTHHCLALELLGPRVAPEIWLDLDNPVPILRKFCQQTSRALSFLHANNICHGGKASPDMMLLVANEIQISDLPISSSNWSTSTI